MPGTKCWSTALQRHYEMRSLPSITETNKGERHMNRELQYIVYGKYDDRGVHHMHL